MAESTPKDADISPDLRREETAVVVVFFDDMKGSLVLKDKLAAASDEQAFQLLRKEHDALVTEVVTRDGAGEVIKSTGDGLLAIMFKPSVAVERAIEIQERLHSHPYIRVRIGMDMGEVSLESDALNMRDTFGRHVDWAARAMGLADAGHICVTKSVFTDAYSWIRKSLIAWKEHGAYRVKAGETPLEIFEPFNANLSAPMSDLRGEKVVPQAPEPAEKPSEPAPQIIDHEHIRLARSWEAVARDGRDFAVNGGGMMYWFKVPLGGVSYPEGFRNFLQPALENPGIQKIRFILDHTVPKIPQIWSDLVIPLLQDWGSKSDHPFRVEDENDRGRFTTESEHSTEVGWVFGDLSLEFTPCFKLLVPDPDTDEETETRAQIFLSTALRTMRFKDGELHPVRVPDAVLRVEPLGNESLLQALNSVANQWDALFL